MQTDVANPQSRALRADHLLLAGAANCLMTAFLVLAAHSGLKLKSYCVHGSVAADARGHIRVHLQPRFRVEATQLELAQSVLERTLGTCFASANQPLNGVIVEPEFEPAQAARL